MKKITGKALIAVGLASTMIVGSSLALSVDANTFDKTDSLLIAGKFGDDDDDNKFRRRFGDDDDGFRRRRRFGDDDDFRRRRRRRLRRRRRIKRRIKRRILRGDDDDDFRGGIFGRPRIRVGF